MTPSNAAKRRWFEYGGEHPRCDRCGAVLPRHLPSCDHVAANDAGGAQGIDLDVLREIVEDWIGEGFTTPPYSDAQYDIFEWLGIAVNREHGYDTRRPM